MLALILAMAVGTPAPSDIARVQIPDRVFCVFLYKGGEICTDYQRSVRDLICVNTEIETDIVCSYNVAGMDPNGVGKKFGEQRLDTFRKAADGQWTLLRENGPPKDIGWFE